MYFSKTPGFLKRVFPNIVWSLPTTDKVIYLTFDDGPSEGITEWVLETLSVYDAKASFFCIGKNVIEHPALFKRITNEGHIIGNHSFSHKSGWSTSKKEYLEDVLQASRLIVSPLFRPPYGRLGYGQYKGIKENYKIIMWDIMSGDFDVNISAEQCASNVINNARNGSIVVFHDSPIASHHLRGTLIKVLEYYKQEGYQFKSLPL